MVSWQKKFIINFIKYLLRQSGNIQMQKYFFLIQIFDIKRLIREMGRKKIKEKQYEDNESQIRAQKKTKKIEKKEKNEQNEKNENKENKEKKPRNRSGAPLGRPGKQNPISVKDDPTAIVQERILGYLDAIKVKHGLVFKKKQRNKMKKEELGIKWNDDHKWDCKIERDKIQKDEKISGIIQQYIQKCLNQQQDRNTKWLIQESLINIGDIAAEECTMEIYEVIVQSMKSKINGQTAAEIKLRAQKLFDKLKFMSLKFTNQKERYWLDFDKDSPQTKKQFIKLFPDIVDKVDNLFRKKMNALKQFIDEQNWMAEQLQKIEAIERRQNR